jgi:UDP-N-acetylglucosamine transferase subunit ALG13
MPAESKKSKNKHVFVTVGTTEFDDLISTVVSEEVQTILVQKGLVFCY